MSDETGLGVQPVLKRRGGRLVADKATDLMQVGPEIPEAYRLAVGDITINASKLHAAVEYLVHELLGLSYAVGLCVTSELSFRNLVNMASSLHQERCKNEQKVAALSKLLNQALRADADRNRVVHSLWAVEESSKTLTLLKTTAKHSRGLRTDIVLTKVDELKLIAEELREVTAEIHLVGTWRVYPDADAEPPTSESTASATTP